MADPDFDRIFAEGGAIDTIVDADYDGGWDDIAGALPPTKAEFNSLQNESDLKSKYLYDRLAPRENLLINGGLDIWQRGTSFSASGNSGTIYTADRWYVASKLAGSSLNCGKGFLPAFYAETPELSAGTYFSFNSTASSTEPNVFGQRIENIKQFLGREVTVSFYLNTTVGIGDTVNFACAFNYGTGSTTVPVDVFSTSVTVTSAALVRYEFTFTCPNTGSEDIKPDNYLAIQFGTIDIKQINVTRVKVEKGSVATPYQPRPIGEELALCQRYYEQIGSSLGADDDSMLTVAQAINSNTCHGDVQYSEKRINPAVTFTVTATGWTTSAANGTRAFLTGQPQTLSNSSPTRVGVRFDSALAFVAGDAVLIYTRAGAIQIDAEL